MAKLVKLPDGQQISVPDDISDEEMDTLAQELAQQGSGQTSPQGLQDAPQGQQQGLIRRETVGQSQPPPSVGSVADPSPAAQDASLPDADPFKDIPTEIGGVPLDFRARELVKLSRQAEDPADREDALARLAGRLSVQRADGGNAADSFSRTEVGTFLRAFGTQVGGNYVAAALASLTGDQNFAQNKAALEEIDKALTEKSPVSAVLGDIGGSLALGHAALSGATKLAQGTKLAGVVSSITKMPQGKWFSNILKASGLGGASGLTSATLTGDDIKEGLAYGLAGGPMGVALAKTLKLTSAGVQLGLSKIAGAAFGDRVAKVIRDPAARSYKAIAARIKEPYESVVRRAEQLKALLGRPASMAELGDADLAIKVQEAISANNNATTIMRKLAQEELDVTAAKARAQIDKTAPTSELRLEKAKAKQADIDFTKAKKKPVRFNRDEVVDVLGDRNMRNVLGPNTRLALSEAIDEAEGSGKALRLGGDLVDTIRGQIKAATKGDPTNEADNLLARFDDVVRRKSKPFDEALGNFERASKEIEGFAGEVGGSKTPVGGRDVLSKKVGVDAFTKTAEEVAGSGIKRQGFKSGARAAVSEGLGELGAAAKTLTSLATDTDSFKKLTLAIGPKEAKRIQDIAKVTLNKMTNLKTAVPGGKSSSFLRKATQLVADTAITTTVQGGAARVGAAVRMGRALLNLATGLDERVVIKMAEDFGDPAKTDKVLEAMRRAKIGEDKILEVVLAYMGGAAAASTKP